MAIAATDPAPAEVITLALWIDHVARGPDTGHAGLPGGIDEGEAGLVEFAGQTGQEAVVVWKVTGQDENRSPGNDPTVGQLDTGQRVVLDHQPCDLTGHDSGSPGLQLALFGWHQAVGVGEEDDVVGPLSHQEGVLRRAG